jgi:hypothetical protein
MVVHAPHVLHGTVRNGRSMASEAYFSCKSTLNTLGVALQSSGVNTVTYSPSRADICMSSLR